jgi:IS30 family transposase
MVRVGRPGLSDAQKREIWRRWQEGQSLSDIGRALGKVPGSIHNVVSANGGFVPAQRKRAPTTLTLAQREEISRGLARDETLRTIADRLGRPPSTISREVTRNGGRSAYRAAGADRAAWDRARRAKPCLLQQNHRLRDVVAGKLADDWSPQQIAGWLATEHGREDGMYVSHETIYRSLFIQARGVLKKELVAHLRRRRTMRRSRNATTADQRRGQIQDAVSIRERPAEAEDRAIPGHWEGDLISGAHNSHIATLVERHSRYVMLVRVPGKDTTSVVTCLTSRVKRLPDGLMRTLTWDRGMELALHKRFTVATEVRVYFCDPQSPWQRGSNENTNGLLRQYFPKGTDLSRYDQQELDAIADKLNTRPRKTLGYTTPADKLAATVAATG